MLKKTIIAAAAVFASFVAFQPVEQAEARVNVHIGLGAPGYYGGGYYTPAPRYYAPRPVYRSHRWSCGQVRRKLRNRGYYRIRSVDCSGSRFTFHAKRRGVWFRIRAKSFHGRIYKVRYL